MPIYQVVVLALIQAFTEFLPVSSSAHLELAPMLLHWKDPGLTFDVALHVGTLVAVIAYFFRDWAQIVAQGLGMHAGQDSQLKQNPNLLWLLVVATIPAGIFGFMFQKQADSTWKNPYLIGAMLILVGILMWVAERSAYGRKNMGQISWTDGVVIGIAQMLALVPGTSRSGITITAGLFRELDRETSARFSFLLSTPIIAGAAAKKLWDIHKEGGLPPDMRMPFALGVAISGIVGAMVIAVFIRYLRRNSLIPFVYYRIVFGIIVIALAYFRVIAE